MAFDQTTCKRLIDHYAPLLREFEDELRSLPIPDGGLMPEPFLPHFGKRYLQSPMRLVVVGQDTRYWGDLRAYLATPDAPEGSRYEHSLAKFQGHEFAQWAGTRYDFHGFILWFLAALHGRTNWTTMKHGAMSEILDSFAWGNLNAIELYGSSAQGEGVPWEYWEKVRGAGERLNRFSHLVETLAPRVAIILCCGLEPDHYFEGLDYEEISRQDRLVHYRISHPRIDILHAPHPTSMKFFEGADHFREAFQSLLLDLGINQVFPEFLAGQAEAASVMAYLKTHSPPPAPDFDKYAYVSWIADELKKRDTFMSVPALCDLVNARGYRTNYGSEFSGGRGSYRLVSGTYHRLIREDHPDRAHNVAVAFRRPNFEYAYSLD